MAKAKAPDPRTVTAELSAAERATELADIRTKTAITVHVDGDEWVWRLANATVADMIALEKDVGWTLAQFLGRITAPHDPVASAVAVWLARRQHGDRVTWRTVSEEFQIGAEFWVEEGDSGLVDPSPLAESG